MSLNNEDRRLASFKKWPLKTPTAQQMSDAGFVHIPSRECPDLVECFICEKQLAGWEPTDDPMEEHRSKECPFLNLHVEANRAKTFMAWPHTGKLAAKNMAKAGFFHCPTDATDDLVQCFHCKKALDGWEDGDDPMSEHLSHSGECGFIQEQMGSGAKENKRKRTGGPQTVVRGKKVQRKAPKHERDANATDAEEAQVSVADYLRNECAREIQAIRDEGETRIDEFRREAQRVRERILALIE